MSNVDEQLRQAAEGKDSPMALAVQKRAQQTKPRTDRPAAQVAAPAPEPVDPIAQAQALLARSDEIDAQYSEFHEQRDAALKREQACLQEHRALRRRHRNRLNDTRWCATPEGRQVVGVLEALRTEVDRLSGITPTDVDYEILWRAREADRYSDFVECVLAASKQVVTARGSAAPILVALNDKQQAELKAQGVEDKLFFRAERHTFYPNGFQGRVEVRRVVRELQQLLRRANISSQQERKQAERLLKDHAPNQHEAGSETPIDLATLLSVAKPSPYNGRVDVALYIDDFEFVPTGDVQPRRHRGVVHLSVENTTDKVTGGPAKRMVVREVVGNIERTLPAAGVVWDIELANYGNGRLGLHVGNRIPDSRKLKNPEGQQPFGLLWYIQNVLWEAQRYGQTVGQVLGLEAHKRYEAWRQGKRKPKDDGKRKPAGQQAQGAAAPAAEPPAEAAAPAGDNATGAPATAATPTGRKPGGGRNRRPKAAEGGNGVPEGAAATPAPADGDPPTT